MPAFEWKFPITMGFLHKVLSEHGQFSNPIVTDTASAVTLSKEKHAGKVLVVNRAAGTAVTLPASTGSGERYEIIVGTTISSNSTTIKVANSSDTMVGMVETATTTGATTNGFAEAAGGTDDTITMNGTTTGGIVGSRVVVQDFAVNKWMVTGYLIGSGTLATSLSATV